MLNAQSCSFDIEKADFPQTPLRYPSVNEAYARDSAYLAYTIYKFNANNVTGSGGTGDINDVRRIDIDTILYSKDSLKLFSFFIIQVRNIDANPITIHFNGLTLVGYRESTLEPWTIYPTRFTAFFGYDNYNMLRDRLRKEFFQWFKDEKMWYWSSEKQRRELFAYEYNVNDPSFWDSCYIWKKGISIPGYYVFQLTGNVLPDDDDAIIELPKINYPDSLIMQYR